MLLIYMCILISDPSSDLRCRLIMCVLQIGRNRKISGFLHELSCRFDRFHCRVRLRCRCHIFRSLRKNNLRFRPADPLRRKACRSRHPKRIRVRISDVLCCTDHNTACNKFRLFSSLHHPGKIIHRSVRIGPAHTLDKSRDRIIVIIAFFIIARNTFLNALLCNLQRDVDLPIFLRAIRRQNAKLNGIQRMPRISARNLRKKIPCIVVQNRMIASHPPLRIIDRSGQKLADVIGGQGLELENHGS